MAASLSDYYVEGMELYIGFAVSGMQNIQLSCRVKTQRQLAEK